MRPQTPVGTVPIVSCARVRANHSDAAKGGGIDGKGRDQEGHQEGREGEVIPPRMSAGRARHGRLPGPARSFEAKGLELVIHHRTAARSRQDEAEPVRPATVPWRRVAGLLRPIRWGSRGWSG